MDTITEIIQATNLPPFHLESSKMSPIKSISSAAKITVYLRGDKSRYMNMSMNRAVSMHCIVIRTILVFLSGLIGLSLEAVISILLLNIDSVDILLLIY
jgi:hypothetical protein